MIATDQGHTYELDNVEDGTKQTLQFIRKEEKDGKLETMINGTTNEEALRVLIDRVEFLHAKVPHVENEHVLHYLKSALNCLEGRTKDRQERGVEGTNQA